MEGELDLGQANLDGVRAAYAKDMARVSGSPDARLETAFYRVHREDFLPPGPWKLLLEGRYAETPDPDPRRVYQNSALALDASKGINNGEPYLHAMWMGAAAPQPGETATQIGLGMGYYSAILSLLVQPGGRLTGFEIDSELAEIARRNLKNFKNVLVITGDAAFTELPSSDLIYVSAGVAAPPELWLAALRPGGRLIFPWRPTAEVALAMLVKRVPAGFEALPLMSSWFIPCVGASIPKGCTLAPNLSTARHIRSLYLIRERAPDESAAAIYAHVWFSSAKLLG